MSRMRPVFMASRRISLSVAVRGFSVGVRRSSVRVRIRFGRGSDFRLKFGTVSVAVRTAFSERNDDRLDTGSIAGNQDSDQAAGSARSTPRRADFHERARPERSSWPKAQQRESFAISFLSQ